MADLHPALTRLAKPFEVILVDDGNTDNCWPCIEALSLKYPEVNGIRLMRSFGQHNALLAGIRSARFDCLVTMDDDLQHPPNQIPVLIEALGKNTDVVYGCPQSATHGLWRDAASVITKIALTKAMGSESARMVSAFRVFRTNLSDAFANYDNPFVNIDVLLTWGTTRFTAVKVRHDSRKSSESNYTLRRLLVHAMNMLTGFSVAPLKLASVIGFVFTLFGFGILTYLVGRYALAETTVPGFTFLASLIVIFSGSQLFALGIMGEYLARMHFRSMNKPAFTTAEATSRAPTKNG